VLALLPDEPEWDVAHRVIAAAEYLRLRGEAGDDLLATIHEQPDFVRHFVHEHTIQTNVVQRCWALLPLFLTVARERGARLDLLELGCAAGLNLFWDRFAYSYVNGSWGSPDALRLRGDEREPVPADLLAVEVDVVRRRGVDLRPLDVSREDDLHLLDAFSFDDGYREKIRSAARILHADPPQLIEGDYVELLPRLLSDRDPSAVLVVFQTISTIYLPLERRLRVKEVLAAAPDVVLVETPTPEEHNLRGWQYPLAIDGRVMAEMDTGADWLRWIGDA
jgi:hypothetical protein